MTNFKPKCGYLGCDPVVGQCLGFCENAKDLPPLDIDFNEPAENEDGGMQMLAGLIILVFVIACVVIGRFA